MDSIFNSLRKLAGMISGDIHIEIIRIYFEEGIPLDKQKDKALIANFQWRSYQILFTMEEKKPGISEKKEPGVSEEKKPGILEKKGIEYFVYDVSLNGDGSSMGDGKLFKSDSKFTNKGPVEKTILTPEEVEENLKGLLYENPNLYPSDFGVTYYMKLVNKAGNKNVVKTLSPDEFQRKYDKKFYIVVHPKYPNKYLNPFGRDVKKMK